MELVIAGGVESMSRAPFVMAKADAAVLAQRQDRGHDDRLALRQSADESRSTASTRCPRPPRTWPKEYQVARADQDAFALRSQQRCAQGARRRTFSPTRSCRSRSRRRRASRRCRRGRASARRHDARGARQAERHREGGRDGDRRQRLGRQRRQLRAAARRRGGGAQVRPDAQGARRGDGHGRRAAAHHGRRPGARDAQGARARASSCRRSM